ncbi:hypothetical protein W02_05820 [Nitrospira sp. KM1]|nr:hypothetical protein W02_05820 [Nitrospira sp. KM1]
MARGFRRGVSGLLAVVLVASLTGCDYWPPALQTQIEQLRSELQLVTAEKMQFQTQLASITKVKEDLQAQVDDLSRANRDKSTMIAGLQNTVGTLQERLNRSSKSGAAKATPAKSTAAKPTGKSAHKSAVKKKPQSKTVRTR